MVASAASWSWWALVMAVEYSDSSCGRVAPLVPFNVPLVSTMTKAPAVPGVVEKVKPTDL